MVRGRAVLSKRHNVDNITLGVANILQLTSKEFASRLHTNLGRSGEGHKITVLHKRKNC